MAVLLFPHLSSSLLSKYRHQFRDNPELTGPGVVLQSTLTRRCRSDGRQTHSALDDFLLARCPHIPIVFVLAPARFIPREERTSVARSLLRIADRAAQEYSVATLPAQPKSTRSQRSQRVRREYFDAKFVV